MDKRVQDYIATVRTVGGVINTTTVMAVAEAIVSVHNTAKFCSHWASHNRNMGNVFVETNGLLQEEMFQCRKRLIYQV